MIRSLWLKYKLKLFKANWSYSYDLKIDFFYIPENESEQDILGWNNSWIPLYLQPILISVKALPHWSRHGSRLQWEVWLVTILAVSSTKRLWQKQKSPMAEVWNHLHLQVCEFWCELYSYLELLIFIDDVDYDILKYGLWLFLTWIIIFDVDYDYFWREWWWSLSLFMCMLCIIYLFIIQILISIMETNSLMLTKS